MAVDQLVIRTTTPGDGPRGPANDLNPLVELLDPAGAVVASNDNGASDGRNAELTYVVPAGGAGNYRVRISAVAGGGRLHARSAGATGTASSAAPSVLSASLNDGVTLTQFPPDLTLSFLRAARFLVAAGERSHRQQRTRHRVHDIDARHVRFDIGSFASGDGNYNRRPRGRRIGGFTGRTKHASA